MKTVRQLLTGKRSGVVSVAPDATVFEALKVMSDHDVGAVVVLDGEKLVGIFSERDYARRVALLGKSSRETPVREIMTHRVICVTPTQMVDECMSVMTEKRCRHLPVVEDKRVVGIISIGDLVKEIIAEQQSTITHLERYIIG
jgi:CBS domain-containing protein